MDDWRAQLRPATRTRNFNRILKTLKKDHSFGDKDALVELQKIAQNLEGKTYAGAATKFGYSRKITSTLRLMESKFQNTMVKSSSLQKDLVSAPQHTNIKSLSSKEEASAWRVELQPNSRQRIVNKIMETLKKHLAVSGQEGLHELQKIAQRFEEKTFTAATSQSDYLRRISLKMLTMETKSRGTVAYNIPLNQVGPSNKSPDPALLDSTAQTGQPNGDDWQEEVYQKIKRMKEHYLPELNEMYQKVATKLQQRDSLPRQLKSDQLEKLKVFKMMLERIITFLQIPKSGILPNFKEKLGSYEKQVINFINTNRPRKAMSLLHPGHLPPPHMHSMSKLQSPVTQVQSHPNQLKSQLQTTNIQGSLPTMRQNSMASMQHNSMSGISTAQQNMMNSMQPGKSLDLGQGNAMTPLQQVPVSSLQQDPVSAPQQTNVNSLSS